MTCRILISIVLAITTGCAQRDGGNFKFPETVAGWRLAEGATTNTESDHWTARYQGTPVIYLELTRMSSGTTAFSAVQSWRAAAGKLAFYQGRYFGVVYSPGADHRTLNRFVSEFEKSIPQ